MVPGPASSQVGYLVGLRRADWGGAFAAWAGFTLPSALVMLAFALLAPHLEGPTTNAVLHGLKLVAVAVVAQAVWSMARNLCPDRPRAALALLVAALLLVTSGSFVQIAALLIGAVGGLPCRVRSGRDWGRLCRVALVPRFWLSSCVPGLGFFVDCFRFLLSK